MVLAESRKVFNDPQIKTVSSKISFYTVFLTLCVRGTWKKIKSKTKFIKQNLG